MNQRRYLEHDWYGGGIPENVVIGRNVYIDSSYAFAGFLSERDPGLLLGDCCGVYDRAALVVGPSGFVTIGQFTCLNGTYLVCNEFLAIGAHCLLSWGVVITDSQPAADAPMEMRREALRAASSDSRRWLPHVGKPRPVTIEDNVWIGFDAVIVPGVTIGRGAVVGCKSIVADDVPPYAVVVGNPARVVRQLEPDDTESVRREMWRNQAQ